MSPFHEHQLTEIFIAHEIRGLVDMIVRMLDFSYLIRYRASEFLHATNMDWILSCFFTMDLKIRRKCYQQIFLKTILNPWITSKGIKRRRNWRSSLDASLLCWRWPFSVDPAPNGYPVYIWWYWDLKNHKQLEFNFHGRSICYQCCAVSTSSQHLSCFT